MKPPVEKKPSGRKSKPAISSGVEGEKPEVTSHVWQFISRFRKNAFGWRSAIPVQRVKEAVVEIRKVASKDLEYAAEGAVRFLEKVSPALEHVDSSSGAIGSAVNGAIEVLVPIIAKADVGKKTRQGWLERLWEAIQADDMPYIETLGDHWGDVCGNPEIASIWADEFLPLVRQIWSPQTTGYTYFKGTIPCLSALHAAGRYAELLALLETAPKYWSYREWGVRALASMGKLDEALGYAEDCRGINEPASAISRMCEEILLAAGKVDDAYFYALRANQRMTHLATFREIKKKFPQKPPADIIRDLAAVSPGTEGKWFAAAKDAGLFDLAIELVSKSPTDPKTLIRAARDFEVECPGFAVESGLAAIHWISRGHGYEITGLDILEAYSCVVKASRNAGMDENQVKELVRNRISPADQFVRKILGGRL